MSFNFVGPVDALLKKDNLTLHDLLNEDEVVSEAHKKKPELITVYVNYDNYNYHFGYSFDKIYISIIITVSYSLQLNHQREF